MNRSIPAPSLGALIVLSLAAGPPAAALDPSRAVTQYGRDVYQSEQGLPYRTILDIAQTPDGYLWIATPEGPVRFDGVRFVPFDRRSPKGFPTRDSRRFLVDRS